MSKAKYETFLTPQSVIEWLNKHETFNIISITIQADVFHVFYRE